MTLPPLAERAASPLNVHGAARQKRGIRQYDQNRAKYDDPNSSRKLVNVFRPEPWQLGPLRDRSPVLLLWGPSGGGKTRVAAELINGYCMAFDGACALVIRKVKEDLDNSCIPFLKSSVIGNSYNVTYKAGDQHFIYDNGSMIICTGLSNERAREALKSIGPKGGIDIAWFEEATEFEEEDLSAVMARMRGTAGLYRQVILTTNPGPAAHWINVRFILGREPGVSVYRSQASDNSHNPPDYQDKLDRLRGVERRRLRDGEWTEGAARVYDTWLDRYNPATGEDGGGNVSLAAEYEPGQGEIIWFVDDGYSGEADAKTGIFKAKANPRAFLLAQYRGDGILKIFAEDYRVKTMAAAHIQAVRDISLSIGWPPPSYVVRDRAALSLGMALDEAGIEDNVYNTMTIEEGINTMREWISPDENGVRRVIVHPRCFHLRYEMNSYSLNERNQIIDQFSHGPDGLRYGIWHLRNGVIPETEVVTFYTRF